MDDVEKRGDESEGGIGDGGERCEDVHGRGEEGRENVDGGWASMVSGFEDNYAMLDFFTGSDLIHATGMSSMPSLRHLKNH